MQSLPDAETALGVSVQRTEVGYFRQKYAILAEDGFLVHLITVIISHTTTVY